MRAGFSFAFKPYLPWVNFCTAKKNPKILCARILKHLRCSVADPGMGL